MFGGGDTCERFSAGELFEPEYHVREMIASFLYDCRQRSCVAVDIGANIGYFAGAMASLGASVIALERQTDLIESFAATCCLNGWSQTVQTINAWVGVNSPPGHTMSVPDGDLGRPISAGAALTRRQKKVLPVVNLKDLIGGKTIDLLKIDIDSIEGELLLEIERLTSSNETNIVTMAIELNYPSELQSRVESALHKLQNSCGYHIYILNCHLHRLFGNQRFFNERGTDVANLTLGVFPVALEELFFQRFMTSLLYVKPSANLSSFSSWVRPGVQVVVTREYLQKPVRRMHPLDASYFSKRGR